MKKVILLLITLCTLFVFSSNVMAASGSLQLSTNSVYVGGTFTVSVNISATAAWNIHVSASGPVSGCTISQADATSDALDTNKTFSAVCTATGTGTINISLSGDVTSAADGNAVELSDTKSVTVSDAPAPSNNTNNNATNNAQNESSDDASLRTLIIEGYELEFSPTKYSYSLEVPNTIEKVNVSAQASSSRASTKINNIDKLVVGNNEIRIEVTAENGKQVTYVVTIVRKDDIPEASLENIGSIITSTTKGTIILNLAEESVIPLDVINLLKSSDKTVIVRRSDNKYSWTINFANYAESSDFSTLINFEINDLKALQKSTNYASIIPFEITQKNIPQNTKLKLLVDSSYSQDSKISLYEYSNGKLILVNKDLKVDQSYVEVDITKDSVFFLTQAIINPKEENKNPTSLFKTIIIVESVIIIGLICLITYTIIAKKLDKDKSKEIN